MKRWSEWQSMYSAWIRRVLALNPMVMPALYRTVSLKQPVSFRFRPSCGRRYFTISITHQVNGQPSMLVWVVFFSGLISPFIQGTDDPNYDWRGLMILYRPRKYGSYKINGVPGNFSAAPNGIKVSIFESYENSWGNHFMDSEEFCCGELDKCCSISPKYRQ